MQYNFTARKYGKNKWKLVLSYKMPDGSWKQKTKSGYSGRAVALAESEKKKLLESVNTAVPIDESMTDITFRDFIDIYLNDHKEWAATTKGIYRSYLLYMTDMLNLKIIDIAYPDCLHSVQKINKANATVNGVINALKEIFEYAVHPYQIIPNNPAKGLKTLPAMKSSKRVPALTEDQFISLIKSLDKNPKMQLICSIAGCAGLRIGEILGLRWDDIDSVNRIIHVERQWGIVSEDKKFDYKKLKTKNSRRTVPISDSLVSMFENYQVSQKVRSIDGRIFIKTKAPNVDYFISTRSPGASIHTLRHTYATRLLANGADIKTVSALLGDTVQMVIKTYIHYTEDMRNEAAELIRNVF